MTVRELIEKLQQYPKEWEVRVAEYNTDYYTEIEEIKEINCPTFDEWGFEKGIGGIGEVEILVR